jgi:hypothetical protein
MTPYANLSGNSGVESFEIGADSITVKFKKGGAYLYTSLTPGRIDLNEMVKRAKAGKGLSTYISTVVGKRYARKLP